MAKKYGFYPCDETFPSLFLAEKTRILAKISNLLQIEHVGSTAVPELGGKGIIDIAILVKQTDMMTVSDSLQHLGYEFRPSYSTVDRLYFVIYLPDPLKDSRRYHIHLTHPGSPIWKELVGFRDYLICHPEAKKEYAAIKSQAIEGNQESKEYRKVKDPFIQETLHKMKQAKILIRNFQPEDVQSLAAIYCNTIHQINKDHYSQEQLDAWAPKTCLETEGWSKKFVRTLPLVAVVDNQIVGFAEFESDGHIDCFYCHHEWIGKGVGSALMKELFHRAHHQKLPRLFSEVSITAKPFFERHGFVIVCEQNVVKKGVTFRNYKMEKRL